MKKTLLGDQSWKNLGDGAKAQVQSLEVKRKSVKKKSQPIDGSTKLKERSEEGNIIWDLFRFLQYHRGQL